MCVPDIPVVAMTHLFGTIVMYILSWKTYMNMDINHFFSWVGNHFYKIMKIVVKT